MMPFLRKRAGLGLPGKALLLASPRADFEIQHRGRRCPQYCFMLELKYDDSFVEMGCAVRSPEKSCTFDR
jgi:hypothetical protein